jgi:hypothetical protein
VNQNLLPSALGIRLVHLLIIVRGKMIIIMQLASLNLNETTMDVSRKMSSPRWKVAYRKFPPLNFGNVFPFRRTCSLQYPILGFLFFYLVLNHWVTIPTSAHLRGVRIKKIQGSKLLVFRLTNSMLKTFNVISFKFKLRVVLVFQRKFTS